MGSTLALHPTALSCLDYFGLLLNDVANETREMLRALLFSDYDHMIVNWVVLYANEDYGKLRAHRRLTNAILNYLPPTEQQNCHHFPLWTLLRTFSKMLPHAKKITFPRSCGSSRSSPSIKNTSYPDVFLCASGNKIPCHKSFLSANSDFFDLLFKTEMREAGCTEFTIGEIEWELLEKVSSLPISFGLIS